MPAAAGKYKTPCVALDVAILAAATIFGALSNLVVAAATELLALVARVSFVVPAPETIVVTRSSFFAGLRMARYRKANGLVMR